MENGCLKMHGGLIFIIITVSSLAHMFELRPDKFIISGGVRGSETCGEANVQTACLRLPDFVALDYKDVYLQQ